MKNKSTVAIVSMRIIMGWFMFFDGLHILQTADWSAKQFLLSAKTFPEFYAWFASPINIWWVDPLNTWGIIFIGVALLLGVVVRPAALAGVFMMILYYFPHNVLPYTTYGYIVEEHIIYASVFLLLAISPEANSFSLSKFLQKTFLGKIPFIKRIM